MYSEEHLNGLSRKDLIRLCKIHGLKCKGKNEILKASLLNLDTTDFNKDLNENELGDDTKIEETKDSSIPVFPISASEINRTPIQSTSGASTPQSNKTESESRKGFLSNMKSFFGSKSKTSSPFETSSKNASKLFIDMDEDKNNNEEPKTPTKSKISLEEDEEVIAKITNTILKRISINKLDVYDAKNETEEVKSEQIKDIVINEAQHQVIRENSSHGRNNHTTMLPKLNKAALLRTEAVLKKVRAPPSAPLKEEEIIKKPEFLTTIKVGAVKSLKNVENAENMIPKSSNVKPGGLIKKPIINYPVTYKARSGKLKPWGAK